MSVNVRALDECHELALGSTGILECRVYWGMSEIPVLCRPIVIPPSSTQCIQVMSCTPD